MDPRDLDRCSIMRNIRSSVIESFHWKYIGDLEVQSRGRQPGRTSRLPDPSVASLLSSVPGAVRIRTFSSTASGGGYHMISNAMSKTGPKTPEQSNAEEVIGEQRISRRQGGRA